MILIVKSNKDIFIFVFIEKEFDIGCEWIDVYLNKLENMGRKKSKKRKEWKQYNKNQQKGEPE